MPRLGKRQKEEEEEEEEGNRLIGLNESRASDDG